MITISPFHIHWSQDARMYALATMFSALVIYSYLRSRPGLLAVAGAGAVLTHYYGVIVVAVTVIYEIIFRREQGRARRQWYKAVAAIVLPFMVWSAYAIGLIRRDPSLATFDPQAVFVLMANVFAENFATQAEGLTVAALLMTLVFFFGLLLNRRENPRFTSFIILGCLLPPVAIALLGLPVIPVHVNELRPRHLNLFAPLVYAGFGVGLAAILQRRMLRPAGVIITVGLLAFNLAITRSRADARYFRDDFRSMMAVVAALTTAEDQIFVITGRHVPLLAYHLDRVGYDVPPGADGRRKNVVGIPTHASDVPSMMDWIVAGYPRFWVARVEAHVDEPHLSPEGPIERIDWIEETHESLHQSPSGLYNSVGYYSRIEGEIFDRNVDTVIPPFITEARPGDFVKTGVPAGTRVDLVYEGQVLETQYATTWSLLQFFIQPHFLNGDYALRVAGDSYPFIVTHSQAAQRPGPSEAPADPEANRNPVPTPG